MNYICKYHSPLGAVTLTCNGREITGLWFDGQKYARNTPTNEYEERLVPVFTETIRWLDVYFQGTVPEFTPPTAMTGSRFQLEVWNIVKNIPYGHVVTYGEIARELAQNFGLSRMSAQAVGSAVGHNPIALIVPCHRVVGAKGRLTGYAGGLDKKKALLDLEQAKRRVQI